MVYAPVHASPLGIFNFAEHLNIYSLFLSFLIHRFSIISNPYVN